MARLQLLRDDQIEVVVSVLAQVQRDIKRAADDLDVRIASPPQLREAGALRLADINVDEDVVMKRSPPLSTRGDVRPQVGPERQEDSEPVADLAIRPSLRGRVAIGERRVEAPRVAGHHRSRLTESSRVCRGHAADHDAAPVVERSLMKRLIDRRRIRKHLPMRTVCNAPSLMSLKTVVGPTRKSSCASLTVTRRSSTTFRARSRDAFRGLLRRSCSMPLGYDRQ